MKELIENINYKEVDVNVLKLEHEVNCCDYRNNILAIGFINGIIAFYKNNELIYENNSHNSYSVNKIRISPDGLFAVSSGSDCNLFIYDLKKLKIIGEINGYNIIAFDILLNNRLAVYNFNRIELVDLPSNKTICSYGKENIAIKEIIAHDKENIIAVEDYSNFTKIFDLDKKQMISGQYTYMNQHVSFKNNEFTYIDQSNNIRNFNIYENKVNKVECVSGEYLGKNESYSIFRLDKKIDMYKDNRKNYSVPVGDIVNAYLRENDLMVVYYNKIKYIKIC